MRASNCLVIVGTSLFLTYILCTQGQTVTRETAQPTVTVPRLITFGGVLEDRTGRPLTGVLGLTFSLYKDREGGVSIWTENQNVQVDSEGRYTTLLGATQASGLPMDLFTSGQPLWLGVQAQLPGEEEQPRVLLVSVPYALKAGDADTLGGKPVSAFVLAESAGPSEAGANTLTGAMDAKAPTPTPINNLQAMPRLAGTGTPNFLTKWLDSNGTLGDSAVCQDANGNVGLGTCGPSPYHFVSSFTPTAAGDFQIVAAAPQGQFLGFLANAIGGSYNPLVASADDALVFGPFGSGSFFLGPWSSSTSAGLAMDASGNVGLGMRPGQARFAASNTPTGAGEFQVEALSSNGPFMGMLAGAQGPSYNPMVQNQDDALIFSGAGGMGSGGLGHRAMERFRYRCSPGSQW